MIPSWDCLSLGHLGASKFEVIDIKGTDRLIVMGFNKHQILWVILFYLPENERKEVEEIVEGMKEDRKEKWKRNESEQKK